MVALTGAPLVLVAIALLWLQQSKFVTVTWGNVAKMTTIGDRDRIGGERAASMRLASGKDGPI